MADISKSQVRFLLDTSMLRANLCKTKLLYEALDLKKKNRESEEFQIS